MSKEIIMAYKNKKDLYAKQIQRWRDRKIQAIAYKGGCCELCGYNKYFGALQFHHKNPLEKDVDWSKFRLRSWDKIELELDKCQLLCANCHAEVHALPLS